MTNAEELTGIEFQLKEMNRLKKIELKLASIKFDFEISKSNLNTKKDFLQIKKDVVNELFEINRDLENGK